jgi:hypothetical protein
VVVVGGLVGGVVVGGAVVGGAVVGGAVVGADGDWATGGTVVGEGAVLPLPGVFVALGDVEFVPGAVAVLGVGPELGAAPPAEVGVETDSDGGDFPLERTANHSFATPCPVASPFLASLTKRYSAWSWKNSCNRPPCTRTAVSPLTPRGAFTWVTPFGNNKGGHALAHAPVHVAWPAGSTV